MRAIPGVQNVALANHAPFSGGMVFTQVLTDAPPAADGSDRAVYRTVSPSYLATMGGALKRGRFLTDEDLTSVGSGLVVNEAFVRRFSSQGDPLGKSITVFRMAQGRADMGTRIIAPIVGVIADERLFGAAQPAPPIVYVPYTWNVWPNIFVAVRSSMPTATLAPRLIPKSPRRFGSTSGTVSRKVSPARTSSTWAQGTRRHRGSPSLSPKPR